MKITDPHVSLLGLEIISHVSTTPDLQIPFYCGNHLVDITKGTLHLYKDKWVETKIDSSSISDLFSKALGTNNEPKHSEMLAMLAIPADVACRELITFIYPA